MNILAMADMRSTPIGVVVVVAIGIVLLRLARPTSTQSRAWLPVAAFLCGPLLAFAFFLVDVFVISRDYITTDDYIRILVRVMVIGLIAGVIGAVAFWIGDKVRWPGARGISAPRDQEKRVAHTATGPIPYEPLKDGISKSVGGEGPLWYCGPGQVQSRHAR